MAQDQKRVVTKVENLGRDPEGAGPILLVLSLAAEGRQTLVLTEDAALQLHHYLAALATEIRPRHLHRAVDAHVSYEPGEQVGQFDFVTDGHFDLTVMVPPDLLHRLHLEIEQAL